MDLVPRGVVLGGSRGGRGGAARGRGAGRSGIGVPPGGEELEDHSESVVQQSGVAVRNVFHDELHEAWKGENVKLNLGEIAFR